MQLGQWGGAGNTSMGGLNFSLAQAHLGDTVQVFPNLGMASNACRAINVTGVVYIATGPLTNFLVNVTLNPGTLVVCPTDTRCAPGPYHLLITPALVGASVLTPLGGAPGVAKTVRVAETGFGTVLAGAFNEQLSDFHTASIQIVTPCLQVVRTCDLPPGQTCFPPDVPVRFRGYVTNCGDIMLTNVTAVDSRAGPLQLFHPTSGAALTGNVTLPPGAFAVFSNSFLPTLSETCAGSAASLVTATARDTTVIGGPNAAVTNVLSAVCSICVQPAIGVTKTCPPGPVAPGSLLTFTGTVTNTGNIALTNVTIVNTRVLTNGGNLVASFPVLARGEARAFAGSYVVPTDACSLTDTLTARGTSVCGGSGATNTATATCAVTHTPRLAITKHCPTMPVVPGGWASFSGVVRNAGNVTLTNVVVVDHVPSNPTVVLGPISLSPGQAVPYRGSYRVPLDCCTYFDTVTATAASFCPGSNVTASATAVCPTATDARLAVTKVCPTQPVPLGGSLVFSGVVSNAGNITLTDVFVVNTQPANDTPVLGPIALAPGEQASFTGAYPVPTDTCATNLLDTLTARGVGLCNGTNVGASQSAACPILPTPRLVVTKDCPASPVAPGGTLSYSGTVRNAGNITLTNVFVVNDHPSNHTPVLGPFTLAPNQVTNFSGSYRVCAQCCPPYVDTVTVRGAQICNGSNVTATATTSCPGLTAPRLGIVVDCPPAGALLGELVFYSGAISNVGDVTVSDVLVTDNHAGFLTQIATLVPRETADFFGFYLATNCGPSVLTRVTATGFDFCTGGSVSNEVTTACVIVCPPSQAAPVLLDPQINGGLFQFSLLTELGRPYRVEYAKAVAPVNWQLLTNFFGNGGLVTVADPTPFPQRFYRVLAE